MRSILPVLLLAACASYSPPPVENAATQYRVGAPDLLFIHVLPDPVIERQVTVRPDGLVTFDLIGDVQAAGRTSAQIAEDIQARIGRFKRDANVTVGVEAARSDVIAVYGEVGRVGVSPLVTETRIAEVIAAHGGPSPLARASHTRLIRTTGEEVEVFRVDLAAIQRGDLATNMLLQGGDIIVVPPTIRGRVGYFIRSLLFPY